MEGALVAHEVLHSINLGHVVHFVIKLNIMKAYDRVNWDFLFKVLDKFGFSKKWCRWVYRELSSQSSLMELHQVFSLHLGGSNKETPCHHFYLS